MKKRTLILFLFMGCTMPALATDWPQWRGPERTDVSKESGLLKSWPKNGPQLLWTYDNAGNSYSGPAIVGNRLYTLGSDANSEFVLALDIATGKQAWKCPIAPRFKNNWGDGPRCTPTVDGESIYVIGGQGELACVDRNTGKKRWSKNLRSDLGGQMMSGWGYCESPLVDGNKVICSPGGSKGALAALDKKTGKVLWRSKDTTDQAAYSSVIIADMPGHRHYVQLTGKGVVGISPKDGSQLWYYSKEGIFRTAVIPTAIYHDGHVYVTSGYGAGCDLIKLTASGSTIDAEKVYANKIMTNQHGGVVYLEGHVYGYSDSERGWVCQDFLKGTVVWSEKRKLGKGSVTCVNDRLYCYSEDEGTAVMIDATTDGWKERGRFTIPQESNIRSQSGKIWTHPVVSNGHLYLRDQDYIFCYDLKERTASR